MQASKQPHYGIDPYQDWVEREGIPIAEGIALDLFAVETGDWPRAGAKGAITRSRGAGDFCSMFVLEIKAGGSTIPQQHLYEEICMVLEGRGSTQLEFPDGSKRSFEWGPCSFFAIPLNAKYRHFNGSGSQRALLAVTTTLPLMIKVLHNEKFIFENDFSFEDRIGKDEYYKGDGDLHLIRPGNNIWETNFIPDILKIELPEWEDRGKGSSMINFALADGVMHAHISEIAPATYKKAHRHESGTHVMTLSGDGYSLLWDEGDPDFTRVPWTFGTVFPPALMQFHQHFVTSNEPSRYVATGFGGMRYPVLEWRRQLVVGEPGQKQLLSRSVKDGGNQIEYEDQDPRIHQIWLAEMAKRGITPKLELPVRKVERDVMLTQAENEMLTRVGPGTPAGELLRRYWHVAAAAVELTEERPIKAVRMLGEDLVLFRMPPEPGGSEPSYGLVGERCPHRLTSFKNGIVEPEGIRCIYHGWKFAPSGVCLETPAEKNSSVKDRARHRAYPVQKLGGLLFAYLGPLPAPEVPRWDVLAREDGRRWGVIESVIDCNWLQAMENSVDPSHLYWLHGTLGTRALPRGAERYAVLGLPTEYEEEHEFFEFPYGIMKRRITPNPKPGLPPESEQHPLVFPTGLRLIVSMESVMKQGWQAAKTITPDEAKLGYVHNMHFRTPVDDEHTMHYNVSFLPSTRTMSVDEDPPFEVCGFKDTDGNYKLEVVTAQDSLAWEAQGAIVDRTQEHLGADDRGVVMLRKLLREQIEIVREDGDPLGVIRDPAKNVMIDLDVVHEPFGLYKSHA